ncbi:hypothetical protein [Pseudomonas sp. 008]|nr:hypothetical protein [Pseudomonas sp. 008]
MSSFLPWTSTGVSFDEFDYGRDVFVAHAFNEGVEEIGLCDAE